MFSIWTMLGTVTGTQSGSGAGCLGNGRAVEQNPGFRHPDRHDRYDFRSIDGVELFQAFFERKALGIAVNEDQHRPRCCRHGENR